MENVREAVRGQYGKIGAAGGGDSGGSCTPSCCSSDVAPATSCPGNSTKLGYSEEEVSSVPEGANLGLGCGNPQAIAELKPGETVLDLGSGGGFDCFLASKAVGDNGHVIGVDMTSEMVSKARENKSLGNVKTTILINGQGHQCFCDPCLVTRLSLVYLSGHYSVTGTWGGRNYYDCSHAVYITNHARHPLQILQPWITQHRSH